jgi:hypothetical protein
VCAPEKGSQSQGPWIVEEDGWLNSSLSDGAFSSSQVREVTTSIPMTGRGRARDCRG